MSSTSLSARVQPLDDPQLRAFVPLLYVAWADLDLTEKELSSIAQRVDAQPWLRPAARNVLLAWLDPSSPPSQEDQESLRRLLGSMALTASPRARSSFTLLAQELTDSEESRFAISELSLLLGADHSLPTEIRKTLPPAAAPSRPAWGTQPEVGKELQAFLDGPQVETRERVRAFLDHPERRAYGLSGETMRAHVREQLFELGKTKLPELAFPGITSKSDLQPFMATFEELAHGDLSLTVKLGVQAGLYGGALWSLGTEKHHARLPRVASLEELGCFAMSEVGHGSNVAELETTALYNAKTRELIIHTPSESARKEWIGGAAKDAHYAVVFAQLEVQGQRHGVHAVLVPIRNEKGAPLPGVRIGDSGHKMGLLGVDNGRLWFEHVRVPVDNLLDRFAHIDENGHYQSSIENPSRRFFTMLGTLVGGRICVGSAGVSAARTSLAIAIRYATMRRQFGSDAEQVERSLLRYPTHRRRLLPHLAQNVVYRSAFEALRKRHAQQLAATNSGEAPDIRQIEAEVAALKILGTRHGVDATQACREACGGQGYLGVNRISDLRNDVEIFTTFEGDNVVLAQLVGKALLSNYRHQFSGGGPFAVARWIAQRAGTVFREKNPAITRRTETEHLRSREFQRAALLYRDTHIVETLAIRMRRRLEEDHDVDRAFLSVQEHVVAAAHAFGDRLAFEDFCEAESAATHLSEPTRHVLKTLGDLHALVTIEQNAAWFLEDGYIEPVKLRAIRKEIEQLLSEVAPHARTIVDAFGIPDACLAAPIAFFDPAHPFYD